MKGPTNSNKWVDEPLNLSPTLLIVDDDESNLESLQGVFAREGYQILVAPGGREALELVRRERIDVVLTDLMMPEMDGLDLLRSVKTVSPETEVILMTAYGTVARAVEAMKEGAYDFVTKPFKKIQIIKGVRRAMEKQVLLLENRNLRSLLETSSKERIIIGNSYVMRKQLDMLRQVANSEANVLLLGESGTGKELFARQLHRWSRRADEVFIPFNCAALPRELAEAELFGHEKGAFTGAHKERPGLFREAHGGTLFLDEVGELDPALQSKLLRVLQEREVRPVGGSRPVEVDVRIVAASNSDLEEMVREGTFREDLYYRLNVITMKMPSLRERIDESHLPGEPRTTVVAVAEVLWAGHADEHAAWTGLADRAANAARHFQRAGGYLERCDAEGARFVFGMWGEDGPPAHLIGALWQWVKEAGGCAALARGECVCGIGHLPVETRWTVGGAPLRRAARMAAAARSYAAGVVVEDSIAAEVVDGWRFRRLAWWDFEGSRFLLHEITGPEDGVAGGVADDLRRWEFAWEAFWNGDWLTAENGFAALARERDDAAARIFALRSQSARRGAAAP